MVPKHVTNEMSVVECFRAVLFRMVPKHPFIVAVDELGFRAVLFRMVPKLYWQSAR